MYLEITVILEWFVSSANIQKALAGELLREEVEIRPEKVPNCCTDENVNIYHITKYFTADVCQVVNQVLDIKNAKMYGAAEYVTRSFMMVQPLL